MAIVCAIRKPANEQAGLTRVCRMVYPIGFSLLKGVHMTTPSRAAEIRRRWARSRKISTLRRQYQSAKSEGDKRSVLDKLNRLVPPMSADDFLRPLEAKK